MLVFPARNLEQKAKVDVREFLDFVVFPVVVLSYGTLLGLLSGYFGKINKNFTKVNEKLADHDTALTVLIQQVNPPGDKSLRELLTEVRIEQARQGHAQSSQQS